MLVALSMRAFANKVSHVSNDNKNEVGDVCCEIGRVGRFFDLLPAGASALPVVACVLVFFMAVSVLGMSQCIRVSLEPWRNIEGIGVEVAGRGELAGVFRGIFA